jgi:hypothetical protein
MSGRDTSKPLECRCTRCQYNSNGACGYQGRLVIDANGDCEMMEYGYGGGGPGPYGD